MGANSVKGLVLMELIWPDDSGSVFDRNPKMAKALEKEKKKGFQPPNLTHDDDVDDDRDKQIDEAIDVVWQCYDVKGTGNLDKKSGNKFFSDALELFALRQDKKVKDILGPGVNKKKAIVQSFANLDPSGTGLISFENFCKFINEADLEEALALMTGNTAGKSIAAHLTADKMFDASTVKREERKVKAEIVYRDYGE